MTWPMSAFTNSSLWSQLRGRLHENLINLLNRSLEGCQTVLDLGCGAEPYVGECHNVETVIGADASYEACRKALGARKYANITQSVFPDLPFEPRSVDAVTLLQVVEHLTKDKASKLIEEAEKLARRRIVITTPNGFVEQESFGDNPFQKHLSGWTITDFEQRNYRVWGLEGPKFLRRKKTAECLPPRQILSVLSSFGIFEGYLRTRPQYAFQLMAIKDLDLI